MDSSKIKIKIIRSYKSWAKFVIYHERSPTKLPVKYSVILNFNGKEKGEMKPLKRDGSNDVLRNLLKDILLGDS